MLINVKKVALRFFLTVGLAASLVACEPKTEDALKYLQEGKLLFEQGKLDLARVQVKNAIEINPKLADAYYQLALVDEKSRDWKEMADNLANAIKLDPRHVEAYLKLGKFYLGSHQFDKAAQEAALVKQLKPGHVGAMTLEAAALFHQGKKLEGIEEVRQALAKEPTNLDAINLLASIHLTENQNAEAMAVLRQGLVAYPEDIGLQLRIIEVEAKEQDYDAAVNDYNVLIQKHPDKKELSYGLVALLSKIGRAEQTEAALRGLVDQYSADHKAKLALIDVLARRDEAEAMKTLKKFAEENPKVIPIQSRLAAVYVSQKRYADAAVVLNHIIELDETGREGLSARVELAKIALLQNDVKTAESTIQEVLASDASNTGALELRAALRLEKNETDAAIADLRVVVTGNPRLDRPLVLLAKAYQQKGDHEIAMSTYRKALEINPGNLLAVLPVVDLQLKGQQLDLAEKTLKVALKANVGNILLQRILARVLVLKKDWNGAQAVADELVKRPGSSTTGYLLSGEIYASQGNYGEAINKFKQVLQEKPDDSEALYAMAKAYSAAGKQNQLIVYLKSFIEKNPTAMEAYAILGSSYTAEKKWDDAVKVLQAALEANPKSSAAYVYLGKVYLARKKPKEAIEIYRKGLTVLPDSTALLMALAQQLALIHEADSAIEQYRLIVQKEPNNEIAVNNLASLLADLRTDKESLQEAAKMVEHYGSSSNPRFLDTYAWVNLKLGNTDKAIAALQRVVADAPNVAVFRYHLGEAYNQASDKVAAKVELERALALAEKQDEFPFLDNTRNLLKILSGTSEQVKSP